MMTLYQPSSDFKRQIRDCIAEKLKRIGFRRREPVILTKDLGGDVLGSVGLNLAVELQSVRVNPIIGIRNQKVEALIADILGTKDTGYFPATTCRSIGYLTPADEYLTWEFAPSDAIDIIAEDIAHHTEVYGEPFMRKNIAIDSLCETIRQLHGPQEAQWLYRLPACYCAQKGVSHGLLTSVGMIWKIPGWRGR